MCFCGGGNMGLPRLVSRHAVLRHDRRLEGMTRHLGGWRLLHRRAVLLGGHASATLPPCWHSCEAAGSSVPPGLEPMFENLYFRVMLTRPTADGYRG
jgi:hypothetical protein